MKLSGEAWHRSRKTLVGQQFGRLTVIRQVPNKRWRMWLCVCDCGMATWVNTPNLRGGAVVSCGCALQGCHRKRPYEWLYNRLKGNERCLEVTITYEDFVSYTRTNQCHYCTKPVVWQAHSDNSGKATGAYNLDRKDNTRGYTKDNIVVCCRSCNSSKGDRFTYEQFVQIGKVIATFA